MTIQIFQRLPIPQYTHATPIKLSQERNWLSFFVKQGILIGVLLRPTKALTEYARPKMKRDTRQKCDFFYFRPFVFRYGFSVSWVGIHPNGKVFEAIGKPSISNHDHRPY